MSDSDEDSDEMQSDLDCDIEEVKSDDEMPDELVDFKEEEDVPNADKLPVAEDQFMNFKVHNKEKRRKMFLDYKKAKTKAKKALKKQRLKEARALGENAPPKQVPKTIDNMREVDVTRITEDDDELEIERKLDEMAEYDSRSYEPKILITCVDKPNVKTVHMMRELRRVVPNSFAKIRTRLKIKKLVKRCNEKGYSDIILINENQREPDGMVVIHLPAGPTAFFRISNFRSCKMLKRSFKSISSMRPEVILSNMTTKLGDRVSRMLGALFHYDPEFKGRRVVTFHNQRDYIFFRHHIYEFKSEKKVALRELGPRFTLRLLALQTGTFDTKFGDYEWKLNRHAMETSRRRFFL